MFQGVVIPTEAKPGPQQTPLLRLMGWGAEWRDLVSSRGKATQKIPRLPPQRQQKLPSLGTPARGLESDVLFVAQLVSALRQHSVNTLKARRRSLGMTFISWDTASLEF